MQNFEAIAGSGVQGIVSDTLVQIGTQRWLAESGIDPQPLQQQAAWEAAGKTAVWIAVDGEIQGIIGIADTLKQSSAAVKTLQRLGVEVVLTGDNRQCSWHPNCRRNFVPLLWLVTQSNYRWSSNGF